jgi:hypothetical protein
METSSANKKKIHSRQFQSNFKRSPCLSVHMGLPSLSLIPHVILSVDQKQSGGLFTKEYALYKINTTMKIVNLETENHSHSHHDLVTIQFVQSRRFSDFLTLHSNLQKKYPRHIIPPLPPKIAAPNSSSSPNEKKLTEVRKRSLSLWLQYILLHGTFQRCDITKEFVVNEEKSSKAIRHGSPSALWETGPTQIGGIDQLQFETSESEEVAKSYPVDKDGRTTTVGTGATTPIDLFNESAYYKCMQEAHTVVR